MRNLIIGAALASAAAGPAGCREEPPAVQGLEAQADEAPDAGPRSVTVFVAREAQDAGVSVRRAIEGRSDEEGTEIRLALAFARPVEARVLLRAYDENNVELGLAKSQNLTQPSGSASDVSVHFKHDLRLDGIHHCNMELIPQKAVVLSGDAEGPAELVRGKDKEPPELRLDRAREDVGPPIRVSLRVLFDTAFAGELQLRAIDASGAEVGRSQRFDELEQEAASSRAFEFVFHETLSARSVESYELFVHGGDGSKTNKKQKRN